MINGYVFRRSYHKKVGLLTCWFWRRFLQDMLPKKVFMLSLGNVKRKYTVLPPVRELHGQGTEPEPQIVPALD